MSEIKQNRYNTAYKIYRIMGIVISFVTSLFLFSSILNFFIVGFQPALLLPLFIMIALTIYASLSNVFGREVILGGRHIRPGIKDYIKVNAYVGLVYGGLQMISLVVLLFSRDLINQFFKSYPVSPSIFYGMMIFGFCFSTLLIIHILLTLRYLKRFGEYFRQEQTDNE